MAYAQGDIILRDHYNTFATGNADGSANHAVANINTVWGVGSGDKGYGQSTVLTAVTAGDTVSATQWSTMIARANSILTHQAGSGSGITSPVTGDIVTYLSTLSGKITDCYNNRLSLVGRGTGSVTTYDDTWSSATPTSATQVRTITFASSDQARYFFNAGGRISLGLSVPAGGTDNNKELAWTTLLGTYFGTLNFDQSTNSRTGAGGTLTINGSGIGFWDLTGTNQTLIRLTDTATAYTSNYVEVVCKVTGTAGSNGGLGNILTFTIYYYDNAADTTNTSQDQINMTLRNTITITPPETTNLSNTWGTVTPA